MSVPDSEYLVLRQTIATRGTVRMAIVPLTIMGWSATTLVLMLFSQLPVGALLSLAVLAAGFETVHALHVGVERIGRYVQVFYEEQGSTDGVLPRWETTAMAGGPTLPGGGVDPLFSVLFLSATVLNLIPMALPGVTVVEGSVIGALHGALAVRIVRARVAAGKQRGVELERYRQAAKGLCPLEPHNGLRLGERDREQQRPLSTK